MAEHLKAPQLPELLVKIGYRWLASGNNLLAMPTDDPNWANVRVHAPAEEK